MKLTWAFPKLCHPHSGRVMSFSGLRYLKPHPKPVASGLLLSPSPSDEFFEVQNQSPVSNLLGMLPLTQPGLQNTESKSAQWVTTVSSVAACNQYAQTMTIATLRLQ